MKDKLVYTFKNFPYRAMLSGYPYFQFHQLSRDIIDFAEQLERYNPKLIIGIAKSPTKQSFFESQAVNIFNRTKKVSKTGPQSFPLFYPPEGYGSIRVRSGYTDSFCNWTMYRISELIVEKDIKLMFIHISENDSNLIKNIFSHVS